MKPLETMTNRRLADELDSRCEAARSALWRVFAHATSESEILKAIKARLGADHPDVAAYELACDNQGKAEVEAQIRLGRNDSAGSLATALRLYSPGYVRVRPAKAAA